MWYDNILMCDNILMWFDNDVMWCKYWCDVIVSTSNQQVFPLLWYQTQQWIPHQQPTAVHCHGSQSAKKIIQWEKVINKNKIKHITHYSYDHMALSTHTKQHYTYQ